MLSCKNSMMDILKKNFFKPLSVMKKNAKIPTGRKSISRRVQPFMESTHLLLTSFRKRTKSSKHQIFNLDLQETPPYFGFPEEMVQRK